MGSSQHLFQVPGTSARCPLNLYGGEDEHLWQTACPGPFLIETVVQMRVILLTCRSKVRSTTALIRCIGAQYNLIKELLFNSLEIYLGGCVLEVHPLPQLKINFVTKTLNGKDTKMPGFLKQWKQLYITSQYQTGNLMP